MHKEAIKFPLLPFHALKIVQHKHYGTAWWEGSSGHGVYTVHAPGRRLRDRRAIKGGGPVMLANWQTHLNLPCSCRSDC